MIDDVLKLLLSLDDINETWYEYISSKLKKKEKKEYIKSQVIIEGRRAKC